MAKKAAKKAAKKSRRKSVARVAPKKSFQGERHIGRRALDALPDTVDFRDKLFDPTLVEVPVELPLTRYLRHKPEILDQGQEGACTGFGLAAVANYLLSTRRRARDRTLVSARMFYEMAKRYDEWPGEDYDGSSARGAMKGWHKHGVCTEEDWPYAEQTDDREATPERLTAARQRPLGAYYRVNHKDLVAMHCAITEAGILYATGLVHEGWSRLRRDGSIPWEGAEEIQGGHAFAIVAYDREGLWIQNSWGPDWGRGGFARIGYADWLENSMDVWVARLGVPVELSSALATASGVSRSSLMSQAVSFADLRPHIISLENDGRLRETGDFGNTVADVRRILLESFPGITANWKKKRLLLYAHGGLVSGKAAVQRMAEYREQMLREEIFPLGFVWHSDFWSTLGNILSEALRSRRSEGPLDPMKEFLLDRVDDMLEPVARAAGGKAQWDEMKENALRASETAQGGARLTVEALRTLLAREEVEIHLAGHSAGAVFHGPLVQLLTASGQITSGPLRGVRGLGLRIASLTLWAPACTMDLFDAYYLPALRGAGKKIDRFALYTLSDRAERDDHCKNIYNKSLLYLAAHAFEERPRIPLIRPEGTPLLGMEKFVKRNADLGQLLAMKHVEWIKAPRPSEGPVESRSGAAHHGDFDDDEDTVRGLIARVRGMVTASIREGEIAFEPTAMALGSWRRELDRGSEAV